MQSGVMEGRDKGGIEEEGGSGGLNSLSPVKLSSEHQLWGDKDQNMHPPLHWESSALKGEYHLQQTLITQKRISKPIQHIALYFHEGI